MKYPTSTKTKAVITGPTIPQDIINEIADHLVIDSDILSIRACALLSKSSVQPCRRHLFSVAVFTPASVDKWFKMFPVPEDSPTHYVKDLRIRIEGGGGCVPERFFKYIPRFTNVEKISLLGYGGAPLMRKTSLWKFPQSATSLTIDTDVVTLVQARDIIAQLPNLDELSLSGTLVWMDGKELLGIGTALRGRFGGKLILSGHYADWDTINMLLEIPSGLHFTEMQVSCMYMDLPSAVELAEACGRTLVKLSRVVDLQCKSKSCPLLSGPPLTTFPDADGRGIFEHSLSSSKFPNLQEVNFVFRLGNMNNGLPVIPGALSTLRPATSPRLSAVRLEFTYESTAFRSVELMTGEVWICLRQAANEVARIEREFEGAVNFTVVPDSRFEMVLDRLKVRFVCGDPLAV